jgi:hypothetical protein
MVPEILAKKTMLFGGKIRNVRTEKANRRSPRRSPSRYFIFLE